MVAEQIEAPPGGPAITDDEIRDWARAAGKTVGAKGRVSNALRAEYEAIAADQGSHAPSSPPDAGPANMPGDIPAPRGSESHAETPAAARAEQRPRKVPAARRQGMGQRLRAFLGVAPAAKSGAKKAKAPAGPRESIAGIFASGWDRCGEWVANVNPPVGRALSWQSDYAGMVAEELFPGTPVDRALQYAAKAKGKLGAAGAILATPLLVWQLEQPGNQPTNADGTVSPAGVARHNILMTGLEDCLRMQLRYLGGAGRLEKLAEQQQTRAEEKAEIQGIIGLFFAMPPDFATQAAQEAHDAQAAAAAAVAGMAPAPGFVGTPVMFPQGPDLRGQTVQQPAGRPAQRMRLGPDGKLVPE